MGDVIHVEHDIPGGSELRPLDLSHGDKVGVGQVIGEIAVGKKDEYDLHRHQRQGQDGEGGQNTAQPTAGGRGERQTLLTPPVEPPRCV